MFLRHLHDTKTNPPNKQNKQTKKRRQEGPENYDTVIRLTDSFITLFPILAVIIESTETDGIDINWQKCMLANF